MRTFSLLHADTLSLLPTMQEQFDMIFADPPYFLSNGGKTISNGKIVSVDKGEWDKGGTPEHIYEFNKQWLSACRPLLKDRGTIWVCGTYHNQDAVCRCLTELGYQILNIITWQKHNPPQSIYNRRFKFSSELIIWAAKSPRNGYFYNHELMKRLNGSKPMTDVWLIPAVSRWEKTCGYHPTQKPLHLLYRAILACTHEGDKILDPFAGSCTTGIAAHLLGRSFVGIDQDANYLSIGQKRFDELSKSDRRLQIFTKMTENLVEDMVLVNHSRAETREQMMRTGICYVRAGEAEGSLLTKPGFERVQYVLLHVNGDDGRLFRLNVKGHFRIWTRETLEAHGFHPEHAKYYAVFLFDQEQPYDYPEHPNLHEGEYTCIPKLRQLCDFMGLR